MSSVRGRRTRELDAVPLARGDHALEGRRSRRHPMGGVCDFIPEVLEETLHVLAIAEENQQSAVGRTCVAISVDDALRYDDGVASSSAHGRQATRAAEGEIELALQNVEQLFRRIRMRWRPAARRRH